MFVVINQQQTILCVAQLLLARGPPREGRGELPPSSVNSPLLGAHPGRAAEDARGPRRAPVGKRRVCVARDLRRGRVFSYQKRKKRSKREIHQIPPQMVEFTNI